MRVIMKSNELAGSQVPPIPTLGLNVFVDNQIPIVLGDLFAAHGVGIHEAPLATQILTSNVYVNNLKVMGQGDGITCGKTFDTCLGTVYIG